MISSTSIPKKKKTSLPYSIMTFKLTIIFLLFYTSSFAQDTLVLYQKKNPNMEYKIPFGLYSIKVKSQGMKKFNALLVEFKDSVFTFKIWQNTKEARKQVRKMYSDFEKSMPEGKFYTKQQDSIMNILKNKENEILYPIELKLSVFQIERFKINNRDRPEMAKILNAIDAMGITWMIAFPLGIGLTKGVLAMPLMTIGIGLLIVDPILESKRINFNKWAVKTVIKNNVY